MCIILNRANNGERMGGGPGAVVKSDCLESRVACSTSDLQGSNFKSRVWRAVSSHSFHHPREVFLAQFSLYNYVHKGGLNQIHSFHFDEHFDEHITLYKCYTNVLLVNSR